METASAWISFFAEVPTNSEFARLQDRFYRRLRSNLVYHLKQLTSPSQAERIALGISVWIDGLWLRQRNEAIRNRPPVSRQRDRGICRCEPDAVCSARFRTSPEESSSGSRETDLKGR